MRRTTVPALLLSAAIAAGGPSPLRAEGFALDLNGGYYDMTNASSSASAVFGGSGGVTFGGGVRYDLRNGFYVGAGARYFEKSGERVFVADRGSPVFRLGHPLSVRIAPVQATFGYRFRRTRTLVPYAGAGFGITSFREESEVGGVTETSSETKASGHVVAGIEYARGRLRFAAEAQYATVPDAIGVSGVSKVYGESDIGGVTLAGKLVFSLARD